MPLEVNIQKQLKEFSLDIQINTASRRIGILGASGCGKSMTLKCIAGIETPDQGEIILDGRNLFDSKQKINQKPQQRRLGYLFQNYALFPTMTVAENVAAGLNGSREEKRQRVREMMKKFHLDGLENRLPGELSGGQQQRVALARIMAYEPELIMLDEPFAALDVHLKEQLQQEMSRMLEDYRGTVILVSHSRDEIYQFSDFLLIMDQGKIVRSGETREIFADPGNRVSAGLTGCKNISAAIKTGKHEVYAEDWNLTLQTKQEVSDRLRYVGIRAHDVEPVYSSGGARTHGEQSGWLEKSVYHGKQSGWPEKSVYHGERSGLPENCLPCRIVSVSEAPFETVYMAACSSREQVIWWKVAKNRMGAEKQQMPEFLYLPPERILLLEE